MKILLFIFLFACVSSRSDAEILFSANYFKYARQEQQVSAEQVETEIVSYDLNFQILLSSRYLIGVTQMTETMHNAVQSKRETLAPNVGFFVGPVLIEGGPVSRSVQKENVDSSQEWREGNGYYAAVTLYDRWASWLLIGFQFTFLDIEYKRFFDGNVELLGQSKTVKVLNPSLRLSFVF